MQCNTKQNRFTGMKHVFVNGPRILKDDEHTGTTPGRIVRGTGYK